MKSMTAAGLSFDAPAGTPLADALDTTKEELYRECIRHIGPHKDFTLTEDEAKTFRVAWERLGTGWPTEQVDYSQDGEKVVVPRTVKLCGGNRKSH